MQIDQIKEAGMELVAAKSTDKRGEPDGKYELLLFRSTNKRGRVRVDVFPGQDQSVPPSFLKKAIEAARKRDTAA